MAEPDSTSRHRIPWLRLAVEGLAVVASILLAFAIDAWWDGLQEVEIREAELANLRNDFGQARGELLEKRHFHALIASAASEARALLEAGAEGAGVALPDTLVIAILALPTLDIANASLEELEMSASISAIRDQDLRAALVAWPRVVRDVFNEEDASTRLTESTLIPLLRETSDLTAAWDLFPGWVERQLAGTGMQRELRFIPIRNSELLRNLLAERARHEVTTITILNRSISHVDKTLGLLASH